MHFSQNCNKYIHQGNHEILISSISKKTSTNQHQLLEFGVGMVIVVTHGRGYLHPTPKLRLDSKENN